MENIDVNFLIQVFNEKISSLMSDIVVKEAWIKQQESKIKELSDIILSNNAKNVSNEKSINKKENDTEFK